MIVWLEIAGRQYYQTAGALPYLDPKRACHGLLLDPGTVRSGVDGESTNVTATLDNAGGAMSRLMADAPIGEAASLLSSEGPLLVGVVSLISLAEDCQIAIQA